MNKIKSKSIPNAPIVSDFEPILGIQIKKIMGIPIPNDRRECPKSTVYSRTVHVHLIQILIFYSKFGPKALFIAPYRNNLIQK